MAIPRSETIRFLASSPELPILVTANNASKCCRSLARISRISNISGLTAPNFCADVNKLGLVVTNIFAMQCRAIRITFFIISVSVGPSAFSILIHVDNTPCWIIIPRTDASSAIRFKAMVNCSSVCSLAFSVKATRARGTLAWAILRIRS